MDGGGDDSRRHARDRLLAMLSVQTSAAELVEQANREHSEVERSLGDALTHAWRSGDALRRAKLAQKHGAWLAWIAEHFAGSQQVASEYMRLRASYPDPRNLPAGVGVRKALTLASAQAGGPRIRRARPAPPVGAAAPAREGIRSALALLQDIPDGMLARMEAEPDFDLETCEWQIDRVRHALSHLKERLVARAPHSQPCACAQPIPTDGYCFTCSRRLRPMRLAS
jgi:hypothetical protein